MYKWNSKIARIGKITRELFINKYVRKKLTNHDFTIFSNDCWGGVVCHALGQRFLSPTVNCYIRPIDFVKFMENIQWYLGQELVQVETSLRYPVAKLADIYIYEALS